MDLSDIIARSVPPAPWAEGDNIPWHEDAFSRRMLAEHLSATHDAASRRPELIDRHVEWIHRELLAGRPAKVLDLTCGPGLYTHRLAALGHRCVGIDYSPASIRYAAQRAEAGSLPCTYHCRDVRDGGFGGGFQLAMLIFGEFNVFRQTDVEGILAGAHAALDDGGMLLLEPHPLDTVRDVGRRQPSWHTAQAGLFSDRPHLVLIESFWDEATRTATNRYYVIDAASAVVTRMAGSFQAYTDDEYRDLLAAAGFEDVAFHASLTGAPEPSQADLIVITAAKSRPANRSSP